jgi:Glycosyl hydrolases family 43
MPRQAMRRETGLHWPGVQDPRPGTLTGGQTGSGAATASGGHGRALPCLATGMGRTPLTLALLMSLALAALGGLAVAVPSAASASAPRHAAAKRKPQRCRATRHHRCTKKPKPKPKPIPPTVSTGYATSVSSGAATLTATLKVTAKTSTFWFQYGSTSAYGNQTSALPAARGAHVTVSTAVGGLIAGNTYHYRVVASSCNGCRSGTAYGADVSFIAGGYMNPVFAGAAGADPFVLDNGAGHNDYWAFVTGNLFPMLHSTDLVHWRSAGTAMAARPSWVIPSGDWHPWGPSVLQVPGPCPGTGSTVCNVLYYTGVSNAFHVNCVGVATSVSPGGPYLDQGPLSDGTVDASGRPIGCGDDEGYGLIDPSPFRDASGQAYLYVSTNRVCPPGSGSCTAAISRAQSTISVIPLAPGQLSAAGSRVPLLRGDAGSWETVGSSVPNVEGPAMVLHGGTYYLFYSGGSYVNAYGMGYATAPSPTGPFTKSPANPILSQTEAVFSPGGGDAPVIGPHGSSWLIYHGREGSYAADRLLRIEPLTWRAQAFGPDAPLVGQPTDAPQGFAP